MQKEGSSRGRPHSKQKQQNAVDFQLSIDQHSYINNRLPIGFSLQLISKMPIRASKVESKLKTVPPEAVIRENGRGHIARVESTRRSKFRKKHAKLVRKTEENKIIQDVETFLDPVQSLKIVNLLRKHSCAWPFLKPVNAIEEGVPDYYQIVKNPMDFKTVERKIEGNQYETQKDFQADIKLIFQNSYLFNHKSSEVYKAAQQLQKYYQKIMNIEDENSLYVQKMLLQIFKQKAKLDNICNKKINKEHEISQEDIVEMAHNLTRLESHEIRHVLEIVANEGQVELNQLIFDLTKLQKPKLQAIHKYLELKRQSEKIFNNFL